MSRSGASAAAPPPIPGGLAPTEGNSGAGVVLGARAPLAPTAGAGVGGRESRHGAGPAPLIPPSNTIPDASLKRHDQNVAPLDLVTSSRSLVHPPRVRARCLIQDSGRRDSKITNIRAVTVTGLDVVTRTGDVEPATSPRTWAPAASPAEAPVPSGA